MPQLKALEAIGCCVIDEVVLCYLQIVLCDQLITYLTVFLPKESAVDLQTEASASATAEPEAGLKLLKKKGMDDDKLEAMFAGLAGKGRGKGAKKAARKVDKKDEVSIARIQHSIDTLSAFSRLKVEVPLNSSNIPAAVESLKVRFENAATRSISSHSYFRVC